MALSWRATTRRGSRSSLLWRFHGRTMGALSLTWIEAAAEAKFWAVCAWHDPCSVSRCVPRVLGRPAGTDAKQYAVDCARFIEEKLFKTSVPPEEVAAIFVEPVQGEGGYVVAPPDLHRGNCGVCDEYGILLVGDEVQSGAGRTGKWWAIQHTGVEPDIFCSAKGIALGKPLSVSMSRRRSWTGSRDSHASTFKCNQSAVAAALATMDIIERECLRNAREVGEYIMKRLRDWPARHRIVGDVRGLGLMIGVEIVKDKDTKTRAGDERDRIVELAF